VLAFLTARYGQFVLLRPRLGWDTALLWLAPVVVLSIGAFSIVITLRRRRGLLVSAVPPLTDEQQRRLSTDASDRPCQPPRRLSRLLIAASG
jgi:cytochrome c-type biogenesis protein CcmH